MIVTEEKHLEVAAHSHAGMSGKNNEDRFGVFHYRRNASDDTPAVLAVVADGNLIRHRSAGYKNRSLFAQQLSNSLLQCMYGWIIANNIIAEYEHPLAGRTRQPRPAAIFDKTPALIRRPAPGLGEHSKELLAELGYDEARIQNLVDAGVIGVP